MPVDKFGRNWDLPDSELCSTCGQPDNCGDCNHTRLSDEDVAALRGEDEHDCMEHAVYVLTDGPIGHGWECGACGAFLQAG